MNFLFLLLATISLAAPITPIRIQLAAEPNTLDPMHVSDVLGFNLISNVAEGLVRLDGEGKLQNGLARSYTVSKDGLTYRFQLKPTAKWSDGKTVTIEDFVFGLHHALDPNTAARDASLFASIKEVKREGEELVLRLSQADSSLLQALTMPLAAPLRKDINNGNWKPDGPSTGAYRITVYKPDREIRLEPNPCYPAAKATLVFTVIPEETTALNLFETGKLDILTTVPSTEIARIQKELVVSSSASSFYLAFNITKKPFSDLEWRKALAAGVDRESLARLQPEMLKPTTSYLPSSIEGALAYKKMENPKLKEWAKKQTKPEVSLVFPSSALANLLLQRLQNDLEKNIGLRVKLEPMEWKAYLGRLQGDAPTLFYMGYSAPFNDPMSHLKIFRSHESDNRTHYASAKYDALVAQVVKSRGEARTKAAQEAQSLLTQEDVVVIPLLERAQLHGVAKGIKGFRVNPYGVVDFRALSR